MLMAMSLLSGCIFSIPVDDVDIGQQIREFDAYSEHWTYYTKGVRRDYFSLDSDKFRYLNFDHVIESTSGKKVFLSDSIYFLQKDDSYRKYTPLRTAFNNVQVFGSKNKIYVQVSDVRQKDMTDCFAYFEDPDNIFDREGVRDYVGELDPVEGKFFVSQFLPMPISISFYMRRLKYLPEQIHEKALSVSLPLQCSDDVDSTKLSEKHQELWNSFKLWIELDT